MRQHPVDTKQFCFRANGSPKYVECWHRKHNTNWPQHRLRGRTDPHLGFKAPTISFKEPINTPAFMQTKSLQVSPSVKATLTPDGAVLLDIRGGMCFPLDPVGTFIWQRLAEGLSVEDIAQQIVETYHISIQQALADVQGFTQQLLAQHLVVDCSTNGQAAAGGWISAFGQLCKRLANFARSS